jgi:transcriptional regulator with XRE-family HTH domain
MQRPDLRPRCGGPVVPYERSRAFPDRYAGLGRLIRQARTELGLTQAQLAAKVGVYHAQAVSKWELEQHFPAAAAADLERVLGIRLPGPRCGRPENHAGVCRSEEAVTRYLEQAAQQRRAA